MGAERETVTLACPICRHEHSAPVVPVVDMADEDTWTSFRDGTLFRFDCPDCGCPMEMAHDVLCQDSAIRQYIYLCREGPDEEAAQRAKQLARGNTADAILRVVCTMDELDEKLRIFENGLDDRVVEVARALPCPSSLTARTATPKPWPMM